MRVITLFIFIFFIGNQYLNKMKVFDKKWLNFLAFNSTKEMIFGQMNIWRVRIKISLFFIFLLPPFFFTFLLPPIFFQFFLHHISLLSKNIHFLHKLLFFFFFVEFLRLVNFSWSDKKQIEIEISFIDDDF